MRRACLCCWRAASSLPGRRGQHKESPCQPIYLIFIDVLGLHLTVDQPQQRGCRDHPNKLIPIEKRKAPQRWRRARIHLGKAKPKIGKYDEQEYPAASAFCRFNKLHYVAKHNPSAFESESRCLRVKLKIWRPPYERPHSRRRRSRLIH